MPPSSGSLIPSSLLGFALLVVGFSLLRWHARQARELRQAPPLSNHPLSNHPAHAARHLRQQLRRRCQIAWLLVLLGLLVPLGDWWITHRPHPWTFTLYVLLLLTLAVWLLLLGVVDLLTARPPDESRLPTRRP